MKKYKLCLFYSTRVYAKILDEEFSDFREIDDITKNYDNENALRNDSKIKEKIENIQFSCFNYISKIQSDKAKKGRIAIVKEEDGKVTFIKPLYKVSKRYENPKILINSITKRLKEENDNKLLANFILNYRSTFFTQFNLYRGISRVRNAVYYCDNNSPRSKKEVHNFNILIGMIKETLMFPYKSDTNTLNEDKTFLYRIMSDYLDSHIYNDRVRINDKMVDKLADSTLDKEKSKEIVNEEMLYRRLMEKAYNDAIEEGRNPSFFDIYREEYKDELEGIEEFVYKKRK